MGAAAGYHASCYRSELKIYAYLFFLTVHPDLSSLRSSERLRWGAMGPVRVVTVIGPLPPLAC